MGIIHGVSNMGGGPLSVLMSVVHNDKYAIRANIAYVYLLFGISQLVVLIIMSIESFQINGALLIVISLLSYLLVGRFLVSKIDEVRYQSLITILILIFGIAAFI